MNPKTLALDQYARDRRRLNTRLGLLMVVLIPLPTIVGIEVEEQWKRIQRRRAAQLAGGT